MSTSAARTADKLDEQAMPESCMRIPNDQVQVGRAGEVANYRVPYSGRLVGTHNIVVRASFRRNFHDVQNSTTTDRLRLRLRSWQSALAPTSGAVLPIAHCRWTLCKGGHKLSAYREKLTALYTKVAFKVVSSSSETRSGARTMGVSVR